jgi:predicted unusual protein kinase regulating ubiquinone biosynthesis (AarF/ABC1/UbiB family)
VPGAVFLILRALVILEGIGKVLHPRFNTFEFVRPYGARIITEQYSADNILNEAQYTGTQLLALIQTLPADIRQIVRKISRGDLVQPGRGGVSAVDLIHSRHQERSADGMRLSEAYTYVEVYRLVFRSEIYIVAIPHTVVAHFKG